MVNHFFGLTISTQFSHMSSGNIHTFFQMPSCLTTIVKDLLTAESQALLLLEFYTEKKQIVMGFYKLILKL